MYSEIESEHSASIKKPMRIDKDLDTLIDKVDNVVDRQYDFIKEVKGIKETIWKMKAEMATMPTASETVVEPIVEEATAELPIVEEVTAEPMLRKLLLNNLLLKRLLLNNLLLKRLLLNNLLLRKKLLLPQ